MMSIISFGRFLRLGRTILPHFSHELIQKRSYRRYNGVFAPPPSSKIRQALDRNEFLTESTKTPQHYDSFLDTTVRLQPPRKNF